MKKIKIQKIIRVLRIILQVTFSLLILYLALFLEIRFCPCAAFVPGGLLLAVSSFFECRESYGWGDLCGGLGFVLAFFWIFTLSFATLNVIHHEDDNRVSIVQALYPLIGQKMADGESIDTLNLAAGYTAYYSSYDIKIFQKKTIT